MHLGVQLMHFVDDVLDLLPLKCARVGLEFLEQPVDHLQRIRIAGTRPVVDLLYPLYLRVLTHHGCSDGAAGHVDPFINSWSRPGRAGLGANVPIHDHLSRLRSFGALKPYEFTP